MNTENITEQNRVIAEFEGFYKEWKQIHPDELPAENFYYHSSWDWLRPVIDKIFTYAIAYPEQVKKVIDMKIVVNISSAHQAVYDFIVWYNASNSTNLKQQ